jgi:hypothetical protein
VRFFLRVMYLKLILGYMRCAFFAESYLKLLMGYMSCAFSFGSCISDCFWDTWVALSSPGNVSQTDSGIQEFFFRRVVYLKLILGYTTSSFTQSYVYSRHPGHMLTLFRPDNTPLPLLDYSILHSPCIPIPYFKKLSNQGLTCSNALNPK